MRLPEVSVAITLVGLLVAGCGGTAKTDAGQPLSADGYAALETMVQVRSAVARVPPQAGTTRATFVSRACKRIDRYSDPQARDVLAACQAGERFERDFYRGLKQCNQAANGVACETTAVQASVTDEIDVVAALTSLSRRLKDDACRSRLVDAPKAADERLASALAGLSSALRRRDTSAVQSSLAALRSASIATSQAAREAETLLASCRP